MNPLAALRLCLVCVACVLPLAAHAQNAFTTQSVNMRAGPDSAFPLVAWIPAGTPVQVFGCLEGWRWCDVQWGFNRGFVWSQALQTSFGPQPSVIFYGGPGVGLPLITFSIGSYWNSFYRNQPWWGSRNYWFNRPPPPPPPVWRPPPPGWRPPPVVHPSPRPPAVRPPPPRPPSVNPPPRPPSVNPPPRPPSVNPPPRPIQPSPPPSINRPPRPTDTGQPSRPGTGGSSGGGPGGGGSGAGAPGGRPPGGGGRSGSSSNNQPARPGT